MVQSHLRGRGEFLDELLKSFFRVREMGKALLMQILKQHLKLLREVGWIFLLSIQAGLCQPFKRGIVAQGQFGQQFDQFLLF